MERNKHFSGMEGDYSGDLRDFHTSNQPISSPTNERDFN